MTSPRFYYGWVIVGFAALSMVATLPGRTVGLGLITEPLLDDLHLDHGEFARLNLIATLLGSTFALAAGPATDRWGIRIILTSTLILLGALVTSMSQLASAGSIAAFLILTRGLGQSALSTTSVTSVGKWFTEKLALAMGIFSLIVALGFSTAIVVCQSQIETLGWRPVWTMIGIAVLVLGALSAFFVRAKPRPRDRERARPEKPPLHSTLPNTAVVEGRSLSLLEALKTPCFWVFGLGMALYSGVLAGVSLFNESILQELGFGATTFRYAMAGLMGAGLMGNLTAAWAARHLSLPRIMALSLAALAIVLLSYAHLQSTTQVVLHASLYGFCGGVFSVLYFTGFGHAFGRTHLGKIQGCAQVLVVLASAFAPWLLANIREDTGSYFTSINGIAPAFAIFAGIAWFTRLPSRTP